MRHGALPPNPERRFVGQRDIALAELGRRQALAWQRRLADIPFAAIVSSDLARCVETARLVKGQREIPLLLEPALRELALGAWEGLKPEEVEQRFPGAYAARGRDFASFRPEGGESFADLAARALPALDGMAVRYEGRPVLMVAHAGVNRVILAHCLALPLQDAPAVPQPYACCTVLSGRECPCLP